MSINQQILFFFSALGAFNGLLLCIYFIFLAKPKHKSNLFLGLLLAALSIRIGKSTFLYFNQGLSKSYLQFGLTACFLIGPFLYLYVRSKLELKRRIIDEIVIIVMVIAFLIYGYYVSYEEYPWFWRNRVVRGIYYQWLVFVIGAGILMRPVFSQVFDKAKKLSSSQVVLLNVWIGVFLIWLAYFTSSFTSYIVGAVSFSFILYLSIVIFYLNRGKANQEKKEKYANKKIPENEANDLLARIEVLMKDDEIYKDSNLNLKKMAKHLNVGPHLLSQLLNDNLSKSFSHFINEYRIEAAKKMLVENDNLKIQAVAELCGFNSNSTFYAAFKKVTGTTPAEFLKT